MNPVTLLARLHREGLTLEAGDAGRLLVSPKRKITDELRVLIRAHKLDLLNLIQGKPSEAELELLVAVLTSFEADDAKIYPAGARTIGPYAQCRRDHAGTWVYIGGKPACRRCELGVSAAPEQPVEPARLSEWFIRHCQSRGLGARRPSTRLTVPLAEQVDAALANGPKSARQVALELDVPLPEILLALGDRAVIETDGVLRMTHFPEPDDVGRRCAVCGEDLGPDPLHGLCPACAFRAGR
jgi:hypothetical protein